MENIKLQAVVQKRFHYLHYFKWNNQLLFDSFQMKQFYYILHIILHILSQFILLFK